MNPSADDINDNNIADDDNNNNTMMGDEITSYRNSQKVDAFRLYLDRTGGIN